MWRGIGNRNGENIWKRKIFGPRRRRTTGKEKEKNIRRRKIYNPMTCHISTVLHGGGGSHVMSCYGEGGKIFEEKKYFTLALLVIQVTNSSSDIIYDIR